MKGNDFVSKQFAINIKNKLGSHLKSITLFGSRARGDAGSFSDYDFLILVDERNSEIVRLIRQTEVELLDSCDALSGSLIFSEQEWAERKNLPIGINIEREGIPL
jgi:predicted nucleotidyltransferase